MLDSPLRLVWDSLLLFRRFPRNSLYSNTHIRFGILFFPRCCLLHIQELKNQLNSKNKGRHKHNALTFHFLPSKSAQPELRTKNAQLLCCDATSSTIEGCGSRAGVFAKNKNAPLRWLNMKLRRIVILSNYYRKCNTFTSDYSITVRVKTVPSFRKIVMLS